MKWFAQAPSNIALIKYMGKADETNNIPLNSSLSYTLSDLLSSVELENFPSHHDSWEPLEIPGSLPFELSAAAQQRFINHLNYIKQHFAFTGTFIIRSANNFPMSSGLASSASSFAALTKCAVRAICALQQRDEPDIAEMADLSRHGSGSSCRSFFAPWALWTPETVTTVDLPYSNLLHQVIVISHAEKKTLSSAAHQLVKTSRNFTHRAQRAELNLKNLLFALQSSNWTAAYKIVWQEFRDMHELFATSNPPFGYMTNESNNLLSLLQKDWEKNGDGPLITMDAGPNIHLLYRPDQAQLAQQFKQEHLLGNYDVL